MSEQQYVAICQCGCGAPTKIASQNNATRDWVKGQPLKYWRGHLGGLPRLDPEYVVDEATGCWVWQGALHGGGYGRTRRHGQLLKAHRAVYEDHRGPIPDGLQAAGKWR